MAVKGDRDGVRRARLLEALADGLSKSAAARSSGYSRKQVTRLALHDAEFRAELAKLVAGRTAIATPSTPSDVPIVTNEELTHALGVLKELADGAEKETTRCSAAKALVAHYEKRERGTMASLGVRATQAPAEEDPPGGKSPRGGVQGDPPSPVINLDAARRNLAL